MKKILILKKHNDNIFFKYIKGNDIQKTYKCSDNNIFLRLFLKFNIPFLIMLFGNWKKHLNDYDVIILFDDGYKEIISSYIKKKNQNIKIILWLWNPINDYNIKFLNIKSIDEFWTYSLDDSQQYHIKYNTQFYTNEIELKDRLLCQDVVFLGRDKGRKKYINDLEKKLNNLNISTKFYIIDDFSSEINYDEYLQWVSESKCILDIYKGNLSALTLRTLESIFFEKKLITNCKEIKNYDFYNSENIFILREDNLKNIKKFIDSPYKKISKKIVNYYDYHKWIKRFFEK